MTTDAPADTAHPSASPLRLRRRSEFLTAAKRGVRASGRLFTIQMVGQDLTFAPAATKPTIVDAPPRFGLTVTKKVAGAVGRNRIRRRLREALRTGGALTGGDGVGGLGARAGQDYVIIARREALNAPFADIVSQMAEGFARLQDRKATRGRRNHTERTGVPRDE
jgi:ribonuclease P protein component